MELQKAQVRTYGFTLRKTKLPANQNDYIKHLARLSKLPGVAVESYVFEYEAGLHSHGIMSIPSGTDFKRFRFRGWNIKLEELWDPQQWVIYMNKHQDMIEDDCISDDCPLPVLRNIFRLHGRALPYKPPKPIKLSDTNICFDNEILLEEFPSHDPICLSEDCDDPNCTSKNHM